MLLKDHFGVKLSHSVWFIKEDATTNFLPAAELSAFCNILAERLHREQGLVDKWTDELNRQTDLLSGLLDDLEKTNNKAMPSLADFKRLETGLYNHAPLNFAIKKVVDYLPPSFLEKVVNRFADARERTEPVYPRLQCVLDRWMNAVSSEEYVPKELLFFVTDWEMKAYLTSGILPETGDLEKRREGFLIMYADGQAEFYDGKKALRVKSQMEKPETFGVLKGAVAYAGKAVGTARIVLNPSDVSEFKDGDVLVAAMTRPEFLPLMKKAGAIVTDAGGLLSHAAIVARELEKPCVVGTEIATKTLKNGDRVEVDAVSGVIRKIS